MAVIEKQREEREKLNISLVLAVAAVVIYTIISL
jgi:hypothetical protein